MLKEDLKELKALYKMSLSKLEGELSKNKQIVPPVSSILNSLEGLSLKDIKVIIIGKDPYINSGQANGLSFSVNRDITIPPSLKNIFKEIISDVGGTIPSHGDLTSWKNQGVLLLNRVLSVELGKTGSHEQVLGWEFFTDKLVFILNKYTKNKVFLLWGKDARAVEPLIDTSKHLVLCAAHPSPLSANKGFFGCKHFSKTNTYLKNHGIKEVDWNIGG